MKYILSLIISGALAVSGYSQTRNVLVNSNNAVVSPTNFWSVDASNARTGLGLGSAATNPASAFQPSSATLSNLASNNAVNLTNLRATNIVGTIPATNIGSLTLTNISGTLAITSGGTGATNAATARTNLGATTIGNALFTATNSAAAINAIGISTNFSDQILSVSNIVVGAFPASSFGFVVPTSGKTLTIRGTNLTTSVPAFFGWDGFSQTAFSAAEARTNLGLNAWTTNTNSPVFVGTNGEVVSPTNFWQAAPINTVLQNITNVVGNATNAATNARMLFLYSLAPTVTNVTSTITLPTNGTTFGGDVATITHLGPTSSVTAIRALGASTNIITLNQIEESVRFIYRDNQWKLMDNISYIEPIFFSGTNAAANAAESRTNLGLGVASEVEFGGVSFVVLVDTNYINYLKFNAGGIYSYSTDGGGFLSKLVDFVSDPFDQNAQESVFYTPIRFATNAANLAGSQTNNPAAITRTNLGIPLAALTNTSVTNFQKAIFYTNTAPSNIGGNLGTIAAWIEIVASNGVTYKVPAYTNVP